jgi:hypothetical protein
MVNRQGIGKLWGEIRELAGKVSSEDLHWWWGTNQKDGVFHADTGTERSWTTMPW